MRTRGQSEVWSSSSGGASGGGGGGGGGGEGGRGPRSSSCGIPCIIGKPTHHNQSVVCGRSVWMVTADSVGGSRGGPGRGSSAQQHNHFGLMLASLASPDNLEAAATSVSQELIDDAILNVVFEVHQSVKTGLLVLEHGSNEDQQKYLQVTTDGLDVFGQAPVKKQHECVCPNCNRNLAASRFAPHLEKCMGMGRNSSRIASRRIQNSSKENTISQGAGGSDDDDDDDWMMDNRNKRRKRDKNSPRRTKNMKVGK